MNDWVCPLCGEDLVLVRPETGYEELQAAVASMTHARREHPAYYRHMWPPDIRAYFEAGQADQDLAEHREWLEAYRMDRR